MDRISRLYIYSLFLSPFVPLFVNFIMAYYLFSLLSIAVAIGLIIERGKVLVIPKYFYWVAFYCIFLYLLSFQTGRTFVLSEPSTIFVLLFDYYQINVLSIILIISNLDFDDEFISKLDLCIRYTIIASIIVTVIQIFRPEFFNPRVESLDDINGLEVNIIRRSSLFGLFDSNGVGFTFLPLVSVFFAHNLLRLEEEDRVLQRLWIFGILSMLIVFFTNSRYVIFGFVLLLAQFVILTKLRVVDYLVGAVKLLILLFVLYNILGLVGYSFDTYLEDRLMNEDSTNSRLEAGDVFVDLFPKYWLWGNGGQVSNEIIEATGGLKSIHVGYLFHLVLYGVVGSFFLFGFWFLILHRSYRVARDTRYWGTFFAFVFFLWANISLSRFSIFSPGLIVALVYLKYYEDKSFDTELIEE